MANIDDAFRIDKLSLNDNILITEGAIDPSVVGYEANPGSLFFNSVTGAVYHKYGPGDTDWNRFGEIDAAATFAALKEPTGFISRTDSTFTFNTSTREFLIAPLFPAISYTYYIKGQKNIITTNKSIILPNTTGTYFIYFDGTQTLYYETVFQETLLTDSCIVAIIYWNSTQNEAIYFADERHGVNMDGSTHSYLHTTLGARFISGLTIDGTFTPVVETDTAVQLSVTPGVIKDEDLTHKIVHTGTSVNVFDLEQAITGIAQIPVLYRLGANGDWYKKQADNFPFLHTGNGGYVGTRIPYNQWNGTNWVLTELSNNHYGLIHLFATNDVRHPIIAIQGITQYQNKPAGVDESTKELRAIVGLPFQEYVPIATLIFRTANSIVNTYKITYEFTADGSEYVDWRFTSMSFASSNITDHGNLTGLENDDHTQYALSGVGSTRTFNFGDLYNINDTTRTSGDDTFLYGLQWNDAILSYDVSLLTINSLNDVQAFIDPVFTDGWVLSYNGAANKWVSVQPNIDFLSDVDISAPSINHTLQYNGTNWVNVPSSPPPPPNSSLMVQVKWGPVGNFTGTTIIPITSSSPVSTQGTQIWSSVITPQSTSSTVRVSTSCSIATSSATISLVFAIFRGTTCVGVATDTTATGNRLQSFQFTVYDSPNTTSPITYSCRVGKIGGAGSWYINNVGTVTTPFGGLLDKNAWSIEEIGTT